MSCLTDYIGIKVCSTDEAPGGGWINSLPGISLESIDKIATPDQITYRAVWADVQAEAYTRFEVDFMSEMNRCYELNVYCDYDALICNNKRKLLQAWKYLLGNQLMLFRLYSSRINRFTTLDIKDVQELKDHYQLEYEKALTQGVKLCDISSCELCCEGNPNTVTWLP